MNITYIIYNPLVCRTTIYETLDSLKLLSMRSECSIYGTYLVALNWILNARKAAFNLIVQTDRKKNDLSSSVA